MPRLTRRPLAGTGSRVARTNRNGIGNVVDPLINLCTLNYILAGVQVALGGQQWQHGNQNLWWELLHSLAPKRFNSQRDYSPDVATVDIGDGQQTDLEYPQAAPLTLDDLLYLIRVCIRPLGIARGSEKQGGQSEATLSPATWPVPHMTSLVLDGKDGNVVNIWHKHDFDAGADLVLRLKPMPLKQYTLNHYYKGVVRKTFTGITIADPHVWQLVPDVYFLDVDDTRDEGGHDQHMRISMDKLVGNDNQLMEMFKTPYILTPGGLQGRVEFYKFLRWTYVTETEGLQDKDRVIPWHELGFWHIGRTQVMMPAYGIDVRCIL